MVFPFLYSIHFLQYIIQKSNIPDAASQNINFGELFVWWVGRQKFSQFRKSHVDILLSPALPFGYGKHIPFNAEGLCCQHVVFDIRSPDIKTWNRSCKIPWENSRAFKLVCLGEFLGSYVSIHRYKASLVWFVFCVITYDIIAFFNPIKVLSSYNNNILTPVNWLAARAVPQSCNKNETCNENYRCDLTDFLYFDYAKSDLTASWLFTKSVELWFDIVRFFFLEKGSPNRTLSAIKICRSRLFWVKLFKRFSLQYVLNHMSSNRSLIEKNEKVFDIADRSPSCEENLHSHLMTLSLALIQNHKFYVLLHLDIKILSLKDFRFCCLHFVFDNRLKTTSGSI